MRVSTFMSTDPVTIGSDANLRDALVRMDENSVRHLPVVDDGVLAGVVSDRDVLKQPDGLVRDVMQRHVTTVTPDDTAVSIAVDIALGHIGCLPVVESGALVGIVTEFDLLRLFVRVCDEGALSGDVDPPIDQVMTRRVVGLESTDRLGDAEAAIATIDVRHAPVVRDSQLVGIISDRDLRRARGQGTASETPIGEFMTQDVATLSSSDQLSQAAKLMTKFKFSAVPIVDGELTGILSSSDVVDHCMQTLRSDE